MLVFEKIEKPRLAIVFSSIVMCSAIFFVAVGKNAEKIEINFNNLSHKLQSAIAKEIEYDTRVLSMVKFEVDQNPDFDRHDFRVFAQLHLSYMKSIQAIEWVPKVAYADRSLVEQSAKLDGFPHFNFFEEGENREVLPVKKRPYYFPVLFLEPYVKNEHFLGLDIASDSTMQSLFLKAASSGKTLASGPLHFIQQR